MEDDFHQFDVELLAALGFGDRVGKGDSGVALGAPARPGFLGVAEIVFDDPGFGLEEAEVGLEDGDEEDRGGEGEE